MRWRGLLFGCWTLIFGLIVFPLRDKVVWSGTGSFSFINWNIEVTKPSVCLRGRWKMSLRDNMVSMAWSEKRCFLPFLLVVRGFHDLMTEGDIHSVKEPLLHKDCSYSFQLVTLYSSCTLDFDFFYVVPSSHPPFEWRISYTKFIYAPKPLITNFYNQGSDLIRV